MTIKEFSDKFELIAKAYSERLNFACDDNWYLSYLRMQGKGNKYGKSDEELKKAFAKELADAFTMLLLAARNNNVDLEKEVLEKMSHWNKKDK